MYVFLSNKNFMSAGITLWVVFLITLLTSCPEVLAPVEEITKDIDLSNPLEPSANAVANSGDVYNTKPAFSWRSGGGGEGIFRWRLNNGDWIVDQTLYGINAGVYTYYPAEDLYPGAYTIEVQERNGNGNWSSSTVSNGEVIILARPPVIRPWTDSDKTAAYGRFNRADNTPYLEWEHGQTPKQYGASGLFSYEFQKKRGTVWQTVAEQHTGGQGVSNSEHVTSHIPDALADGEYRLRVREYNLGGTYSVWETFEFLVDTGAPTQIVSSFTHAGSINDNAVRNRPYLYSNVPETVTVDDKVYLIAVSVLSNGISIFQVEPGGVLRNTDNVRDGQSPDISGEQLALYRVNDVAAAVVNGTGFAFAGGVDDGVSVFRINDDGTLTNTENVDKDRDNLPLDSITGLTTAVIGGNTYLFVSAQLSRSITSFRVNNDGTLTAVDDVVDNSNLFSVTDITSFSVNEKTFLYTVSRYGPSRVSRYEVNNDGSLQTTPHVILDTAALHLDRGETIAAGTAGNTHYVFAAGKNDNGISTFTIDASTGNMTAVSASSGHPTSASYGGLRGASGLAVITSNDITYLFVAGSAGNAVEVFRINEDTADPLTHLFTQRDNPSSNIKLAGVYRLAAAEVNNVPYVFAGTNGNTSTARTLTAFRIETRGGSQGNLTYTYAVDSTHRGLQLDGPTSITTAVVNGTSFIFTGAGGHSDKGISTFRYDEDEGAIINLDNIADNGTYYLRDTFSMTTVERDGKTYLLATGYEDDGVSVFEVKDNGTLHNTQNTGNTGALNLDASYSIVSAFVDDVPYAIVSGAASSGLSVFELEAGGTLTNTFNIDDGSSPDIAGESLYLSGVRTLATAAVKDTVYVFAGGYSDSGVSVFRLNAGGTLTNVFNLADTATLHLSNILGMAAAPLRAVFLNKHYPELDKYYLFVGSFTENGMSVFEINADGSLKNTANVRESDNASEYYLDAVLHMTASVVDNTTYVLTAARDNGLSAFRLLYDGTVLHDASVGDSSTVNLQESRAAAMLSIDSTHYVFGVGTGDDGVSAFSITP